MRRQSGSFIIGKPVQKLESAAGAHWQYVRTYVRVYIYVLKWLFLSVLTVKYRTNCFQRETVEAHVHGWLHALYLIGHHPNFWDLSFLINQLIDCFKTKCRKTTCVVPHCQSPLLLIAKAVDNSCLRVSTRWSYSHLKERKKEGPAWEKPANSSDINGRYFSATVFSWRQWRKKERAHRHSRVHGAHKRSLYNCSRAYLTTVKSN